MISLIKATQSSSDMRDIASRICRDYLTGAWKVISSEEIQMKRISGGLSNFLYYVSLPDRLENNNVDRSPPVMCNRKRVRRDSGDPQLEPKEVLLRIYGQTHGENALETMLTESVVFTLLSERKLGPKLHGIFPGGRIEEYIPARSLVTKEMYNTTISRKIAEKMAEIHNLDIPVSKEPDWLWNTMNRWIKKTENILNLKSSANQTETGYVNELRKINFQKEANWLRNYVESKNYSVVFSHNDLQEGNILYKKDSCNSNSPMSKKQMTLDTPEESGNALDSHFESILISSTSDEDRKNGNTNSEVTDLETNRDSVLSENSESFSKSTEPDLMVIDFEYCAYNYRGFDIANHFMEWTFDYTNTKHPFFHHHKECYPSKSQQETFISSYLLRRYMADDYTPTQDEIKEIIEEVRCFTMATHLFWSLWAIVNVHQGIEFGYWDFAVCRVNEYYMAKKRFLKTP